MTHTQCKTKLAKQKKEEFKSSLCNNLVKTFSFFNSFRREKLLNREKHVTAVYRSVDEFMRASRNQAGATPVVNTPRAQFKRGFLFWVSAVVQTGHELNVRLRGKSSSFDLMNNKFLKNS